MTHVGEIMGFGLGLQGGGRVGATATATATATLVDLLRGNMDGSDRLLRRKTFRIRLGFNGCCGATWGFGPAGDMALSDDVLDDVGGGAGEEEGGGSPAVESANGGEIVSESGSTPACGGGGGGEGSVAPASSGMNLAAALAVEREFRSAQEVNGLNRSPARPSFNSGDLVGAGAPSEIRTPLRVSLMKLLEQTDGCDDADAEKGGTGSDSLCCVCMGRKKGAAFIPCGHTFCRVCSRELWLNRGSCPLCNRLITEVLDIF